MQRLFTRTLTLLLLVLLASSPVLAQGDPPAPVYLPLSGGQPDLLDTIGSITAGGEHTCALTTTGGVKCWGGNGVGQLGDGTATSRTTPVDVVGLSAGVKAITVGAEHTCALMNEGGVQCWGANYEGQLGDGTTELRLTPVDVVGLSSGVQAIGGGYSHTCALTTTGGVKCWGNNYDGQLGDGTTEARLTPVDVVGVSRDVQAVAVGTVHSCAFTNAGGVKCWGSNEYGQLGDGTTTNRTRAVNVTGLSSGAQALAVGGEHTCVLTIGGSVKCWGYNYGGQLGDGTWIDRRTAGDVVGLTSGVVAITTRDDHTCALTSAGGVKCWGNNVWSQLGDGTTTNANRPIDVVGLTMGVRAIAAGDAHTCALTVTDNAKCWGFNWGGQLGDGTLINRLAPVDVLPG